jgi:hypothetical protein
MYIRGNAPSSWRPAALALALAGAMLCTPATAETGRSVIVVLDASGSMNERLPEGGTRLEAAKAAVADFVGSLAPDIRLALRVYGHQSTPDKKNCQDSELVAGFAPVAEGKAALLDKVAGLRARGYTPITHSLQLAAKDISGEASAQRTVVLVSDGRETCSADPCVAARALAAADARLVVHTIGLGVDRAARSQLQCIASVARGSYFDAGSRAELTKVIGTAAAAKRTEIVVKVVTAKTGTLSAPRIKQGGLALIEAETGKEMGFIGGSWPKRELPVGIYSVKMTNGTWTGIEIKAGQTTLLEPAFLRVDLGHVSGQKKHENMNLLDPETGQEIGYFGILLTPEVALVPGRVVPSMSGFKWPAIDVSPDRTTVLKPGAFRVTDPLGEKKILVYYLKSRTSAVARFGDYDHLFRPNLPVYVPPGKYVAWSMETPQQKIEFEVADGEIVEIKIDRQ